MMATDTLHFSSPRHLSELYGSREEHLRDIEHTFKVQLVSREGWVKLSGEEPAVAAARAFFELLDTARTQGLQIGVSDFAHILEAVGRGDSEHMRELFENPMVLKMKRTSIVPKTLNQKRYLQYIRKFDIVFGIGPAGTGKTYLAMAEALRALANREVGKIILARPAVEAGEALGFLPGDLTEKILPYLRPLYDAIYDMSGREEAARMMEKGMVEIAPLAYMRGRTLTNAFIILDEAQNTTCEQMMMFLTRLGDNSRMVVTGDITQIDLPRSKLSGLKQVISVLSRVEGVKLFHFDERDVVRHPLVSRIIQAYDHHFAERGDRSAERNG